MRKLVLSLLATATLIMAPVISALVPGIANAASGDTFQWTGGDHANNSYAGNLGCDHDCWSDPDNWDDVTTSTNDSGPQASDVGDTIIIDNSASDAGTTNDDLAGLSISNLEFTNNSGGGGGIYLLTGLTITTAITQEASDTTSADFLQGLSASETVTLNGNVDVTTNGTGGLSLGQTGGTPDVMAVGSNTITFDDDNDGSAGGLTNNATITGSNAVIDYNGNGSTSDSSGYAFFSPNGANTYTGTTNVENGAAVFTNNTHAFGPNSASSVINIGSTGEVSFEYDASGTVDYTINVTGQSSIDNNIVDLGFNNNSSATTTLNFPNITLNGDAVFYNGSTSGDALTVNLSGITNNNSSCIEYLGLQNNLTESGAGFENGPNFCVLQSGGNGGSGSSTSTTPAPKTPDTGAALIEAHPVLSLIGTIMLVTGSYLIYRRLQPSNKRH